MRRALTVLAAAALFLSACGGERARDESNPAQLLAQVDGSGAVEDYDERLDILQTKCEASSRMRIADNVAGAVKVLEDNGRKEKALDIMDGMIEAIPEGSEQDVTCEDIATGLVTIMLGGSVDATPRP